MPAVYSNFVAGQVSDDPLTLGATTINSAGFANLPVVASPDFLWITLDPDGVDGLPEVVKVTAHTSAATSVTVQRGQQGSVARAHDELTEWRHSWTATDASAVDVAVPVGTIVDTLRDVAPTNWVLCQGQTLSGAQTAYPALWAALPATFKSGSDIVLPDLRGRVTVGAGTGSGLTARVLAATGGAETHTLTTSEMPSHQHGTNTGGPSNNTSGGPSNNTSGGPSAASTGGPSTNSTGEKAAFNTGNQSANHTHSGSTSTEGSHSHAFNVLNSGGFNDGNISSGHGGTVLTAFNTTSAGSHSHTFTTGNNSANHYHTVPAHSHTLSNHTHSLQSHTHTLSNHTHTLSNHTHTISAEGGGTAHNNMQPFVVVNKMIRVL